MGWLWFALGAVMGSAADALIDRLPKGEKWWRGRSRCDSCRHQLGWRDLVPIVSFLVLGGRCRYCRRPIPARNLVVEVGLGTGFFLISNLSHLSFLSTLSLAGMLWVTVVIAVMDWETMLVSEVMVLLWGGLAAVSSGIGISNGVGLAVAVGMIGGIWALSRGRAMGFGDVEIAAVMGWWLGWPRVAPALWMSFVAGAAAGGWWLAVGKKKMKSQMPFGPFLIIGSWMGYFAGDMMWKWLFPF